MGLKMRFNLFFHVPQESVYAALSSFYTQRNKRLTIPGDDFFRFDLHQQNGDWTILNLGGGWHWAEWCEAQLSTSKILNCSSFLMFVNDGDYWGYQLCSGGIILDRFIQRDEDKENWFPGDAATGSPSVLRSHFPWLDEISVAPYLVKMPEFGMPGDCMAEYKRLNIRVAPDDEFCRFDECAILNFLHLLKIGVKLQSGHVEFEAPIWKSFWIEGRQRFGDNKEEAAKIDSVISEMLARERRTT